MIRKIYNKICLLATVLAALAAGGCADDFRPDSPGAIPDGRADMSVEAAFMPMGEALTGGAASRGATAGNALSEIETLVVVMYDRNGANPRVFDYRDFRDRKIEISDEPRTDDNAPNGIAAEAATKCARFALEDIDFGEYRIYVVANMGDRDRFMADYGDQIATPADLRSIKLKWNSEQIVRNNQMLGVVTPASAGYTPRNGADFEAPLLRFTSAGLKLHCWLRRAASKVTITMDGSDLRESIRIYFRNATIRHIPSACTLGERNTPDAESVREDPLIEVGSDSYDFGTGDSYLQWPSITRGVPTLDENRWNHSENAPALFFFENAQRDYTFDADRELYDKRQEPARDENGNYLNEVKDKTDLKDKVAYGSYIEVEGYYVSRTYDQTSNGKIIYRFMLGQDEKFNYEAFRNCHYKLTMRFRGNANDVDWHIEYKEDFPQIYAPEKYYISYLYDRSMTMPLRVNIGRGYRLVKLEGEIISNNWAPSYDDNPMFKDPSGTTEYSFTYNQPWYLTNSGRSTDLYPYGADEVVNSLDPSRYNTDTYLGFLSLRRTKDKVIGGNTHDPADLMTYYNTERRGVRTYYDASVSAPHLVENDAANGTFNISQKTDTTITFQLPFYTRAKTMSRFLVYTGNNPFPYSRTAVVRFTATFEDLTRPGVTIRRRRRVVIDQVERCENPKGVWRAWDNDDQFNITMMAYDPRSNTYSPIVSDGPWLAEIAAGKEWVRINGNTTTVKGSTGTKISFNYKPAGKCANAQTVRHGVIRIRYNNYTCTHLVFLRQGYEAQAIVSSGQVVSKYTSVSESAMKTWTGRKWSVYNLYSKSALAASPLAAGSYYKLGNLDYPIAERNNSTYKLGVQVGDQLLEIAGKTAKSAWSTIKAKYSRSTAPTGSMWGGTLTIGGHKYEVARHEDYDLLMNYCEEGYGVMYADGATSTATTESTAHGYVNNTANTATRSANGMRGVFLYNAVDSTNTAWYGRNIFFPLSASGHGRRQNVLMAGGQLRYGDVSYTIGPNVNNNPRVMIYDLLQTPGAMYWYDRKVASGMTDGAAVYDSYSHDINYYMFSFDHYHYNNVGKSGTSSDALLLRLIRTD